jgi:hypothetical protein
MNPKEKAVKLFNKFCYAIGTDRTDSGYYTNIIYAKQCALIAVTEIINSNPHSNPFNTDIHSTMQYWIEVKKEIEKL